MKVLLVDDHPLFLDGLKSLMTVRGMDVVGTARNGLEALDRARETRPDVVLMDITMPYLDGFAATRLIRAELPEVKILILTMSQNDEDLFTAIKAGASGYLLKTEDTDRFFDLLTGSMHGEAALSAGLASRILDEFAREAGVVRHAEERIEKAEPLTTRQIEVLTLVAAGYTYKEVGQKLFLSERTIKYHMGEIIDRLQVENRRQAVEYARRANLRRE